MHWDIDETTSTPSDVQFHHISTNKTTAAGHMSKFFYVIDCEIKSNHIGHNDAISVPSMSLGQVIQGLQKYWFAAANVRLI